MCRRETWSALAQDVTLQPDTHYYVSMMVKLLNQSDDVMGEELDLNYNYDGEYTQ